MCLQEPNGWGTKAILDSYTLMGAVAAVLAVMAVAFHLAGRDRADEPYWASWSVAHLILALALVIFMLEARLPLLVAALLPNALLVLGFGLRWKAARQFADRPVFTPMVYGPSVFLAFLCLLPPVIVSFGAVFTLTNVALAVLAGIIAWEFWRDRGDGLASRTALMLAYALIAISFGVRVGQGLVEGSRMEQFLPLDTMLAGHLFISVVHAAMSGAFAISLAFERKAATLRHAAMHDGLTGLLNRAAFENLLRSALTDRAREPFAVAIFDLDHFKTINDRLGHAAGDAAIRACADTLAREAGSGNAVARIGGEEFAAIIWDVSDDEAARLVEHMRRAIETQVVSFDDHVLRLTASAGFCHSGRLSLDFDSIMRRADAGLYAAKRGGRNRVARAAA